MNKIPCWLEFDETCNVVSLRHAKTGTIQMLIKLEAGAEGTHTRIKPHEDCDNFWIAVKPADSTVFEGKLFGRSKLAVTEFKFDLEP